MTATRPATAKNGSIARGAPRSPSRSAPARSRRPAAGPRLPLSIPEVPLGQVAGTALISLSLIGLLALTWPEGPLFAPLASALTQWLGWLAGLPLLWLGGLGLLVVAPQVRQHQRFWAILFELGGLILCVLTLDAMLDARTPGILGHRFAGWLTSLLGGPPSVLLVVAGAGLCAIAAADLRANQIWHALRASGQLTWELTTTAAGYVADVFGIVAEWVRDRRAVASVRKLANSLPDPVPSQPLTEGLTEAPAEAAVETRKALPSGAWEAPSLEILAPRRPTEPVDPHLRDQARVIEETLASFGIEARVLEINQGPAVTQFGVEPAPGVPVSRILARMNDLALRLGAAPIRMEAPVPGRRMLGIEVPNLRVSVVGLREVLESEGFARSKAQIPLALGRDIAGKPVVADLARMPHLLIAGATGSGKSVCINALVACLLSQFTPDQLQFVMVDPKMVELIGYNGIPHLRMPVVTDMDRIVGTLKWVAQEMERRYKLFAAHTQRNIDGFNQLARKNGERALPYLVVIIDELADLMMTAPEEAEKTICRLAQLARATGIHLVVATQRPSVDVVTGLIKANFPSRIAFAVTSQIDSRVILDMGGAERLLGRGDMLYLPPDASKLIRVQGTYVAEEEIEALVTYWKDLGSPQYNGQDLEDVETLGKPADPTGDELYERAVELAQQTRRISVSLLQRRLGIGYPRAARLVDQLEEHGIISAAEDGRAREVLVQGELTPPE